MTPVYTSAAIAMSLFTSLAAVAQDLKRFYIANDDHTDYMWTADADTYGRVFVEMLDFHMDLADETASNPVAFQNRFNADGSYWIWEYEHRKTPAEFQRLIGRIKDGTISVPLNLVVSCYGGQPVEAVLRGMYYAGRLERRHGLRLPLATAMENQTLPLGLASLFAGSGATYSWRGVCGCASRISNKILAVRPREIYWYTGHDGQRLLMKWYSLGAQNIGGYWEAGNPPAAIKSAEANEGFQKRYVDPVSGKPYTVIGLFGFGGDDLGRLTGVEPRPETPRVPGLQGVVSSPRRDHFHISAQQMTTANREVFVSNEIDFFREFESRYGATLDSHTVTYGNEWDLYSASVSETAARAKRAVEKLRTAELLSTLVSMNYPQFMDNHIGARDRAFNSIGLFWEHNWTADGPIPRGQRAAWGELQASHIEYYVNSIYSEGIVRLGGMIPRPENANRFFVLNSLGWSRTEFADFRYSGNHDIHVRDIVTSQDVPHQIVKIAGATFLRILANDVPPAGYKVFEILPGPGTAASDDAANLSGDAQDTVSNGAITIAVDRDGAIRSLLHSATTGTDATPAELAGTIAGLRVNDLGANSEAGEPVAVVNRGPVSVTLRARSTSPLDHTTFITVYRNSTRIDIHNEINSNFSDVRYWAFSFNLKDPAVHTEEVGAINLNKLQSQGGHYANTHSRYDYVTVNHFADISSSAGNTGITLSNPDLAFAKLGNSTTESLDVSTPQIHMLAGGQVDGPSLGIRGQNGNAHFVQRFALRPHAGYDPVAAMKFALEHQNPLATGAVISKSENGPFPTGVFPANSFSLLNTTDPGVLLWAVKPADDGIDKGLIVRLWNVSDTPATTTLTLAPGITAASQTTHIETDVSATPLDQAGGLSATFARQQLQTFRVIPGRLPPPPKAPAATTAPDIAAPNNP